MKAYKYLVLFVLLNGLGSSVFAQDIDGPATEGPAEPVTKVGDDSTPDSRPALQVETLASETNQVSYAIGINLARNLQHNYPNINLDFVVLALRDAFGGIPPRMNENAINASIVKYSEESNRIARERVESVSEKNLRAAEKFLAENRTKDNVVTTPSGLQYRVINEGTGEHHPRPDGTATFKCTTRIIGGGIVDTTQAAGGKPKTVELATTIPAWREALLEMGLGSTWEVFAHPKLAYGENGSRNIGPNELLIFTIELTGFN